MKKLLTIKKMALVAAISALVLSNSYGTSATIQNAGFETYIAASDSFAFWKTDKDATGTKFKISQETTSPASGTGALKMEIMAGADTSTECRATAEIKNLPAKKLFTVTAKVKYSNMPIYWNGMFHLQQATMNPPDYKWIDRKWLSFWGNDPGTVADWASISKTDTTADSANIFNLIISLHGSGTLWVDDIAITYTDIAPVTQKAVTPARQGSILKNRISFPHEMPYTLEAYQVNGKLIQKTAGIANAVNCENLGLSSGAYLIKAKTKEKIYSGRVVLER